MEAWMNNGHSVVDGDPYNRQEPIIKEYTDGNVHVSDPWMQHAIDIIWSTYWHRVGIRDKSKDLVKFGRNEAVGTTRATIMDLPSGVLHETYVSTNAITTVSSSSSSDTRQVTIEGHTIDGDGDLTFLVQNVTLNGQTQVSLGTNLARCTRLYANESSETTLVGNIYVYETDTSTAGVPDTSSKVHLLIPAGEQQSRKASTTISYQDYWIITGFDSACYEKVAAYAEVRLEIKRKGGVFRPTNSISVNSGGFSKHEFYPYLICPPNSDIRLTSVGSGAGTDVGGSINGVLAVII